MPTITKKQLNNLAVLSAYLRTLPKDYKHFDMSDFAGRKEQGDYVSIDYAVNVNKTFINECGTSACACGHAPLAGIKPLDHEDWDDYSGRVFGVQQDGENPELWDHMFAPEHPNDPHLAADRIDDIVTSAGPVLEVVEVSIP